MSSVVSPQECGHPQPLVPERVGIKLSPKQRRFFDVFGYIVFPGALSADEMHVLCQEFDSVMTPLRQAGNAHSKLKRLSRFLMDEDSPALRNLAIDERFAGMAAQLLRRPAICIQVVGAYQNGNTGWHSDNLDLAYRGVKFLLYLDVLHASSGALRVMPGSHRHPSGSNTMLAYDAKSAFGVSPDRLPSQVLATRPGDLIAFSHPLWHASFHGRRFRRVVEVNFYADPRTQAQIRGFVAQMRLNHDAATAAGVKMYPPSWLSSMEGLKRQWNRRLTEIGVLDPPR